LKSSIGADIVYNEGYTEEDKKAGRLNKFPVNPAYPHIYGGAVKLANEGEIELRPAETEEMNRRGLFEMSKLIIGEPTLYLMEGRESTAIELIGRDNPRLAVLVYGAGHDFRDDIERWNFEHEDIKFYFDDEGVLRTIRK